ncbi:MAG: DUF1934 domain-containing protein [Eubacteriaceae bacterium]|jgi:Uncharacterized protein conserved in bacteria|nr:DUF1934 domain-containing protein [Eubacteriaceae bacterium]
MKNVTLKISGYHIYDDKEENQLELITEGKLYTRGNSIFITYDESEFSGMVGCKTRLQFDEYGVKMTRRGSSVGIDTEIHFEKGKRYNGYYDTVYGPVEMEVLTNGLTNSVTPEGNGEVDIDYNISLKGLSEGRSRLNIKVHEV